MPFQTFEKAFRPLTKNAEIHIKIDLQMATIYDYWND